MAGKIPVLYVITSYSIHYTKLYDFLERIAENFVLLNEEKKELKDKVERLEMEVNKFYSQERTFQHAIVSAQRIADEMLDKSRKSYNFV